MKIADLFDKDIRREINGVIKVGQRDEVNLEQELSEYVVTKELDKHFHAFFERYTSALDQPTDKMGVWISGFFGSGKSHFLKILSYLLENRQVREMRAVEYFDEKRVPDSILRSNINRSANISADVILFNIDSKADSTSKNQKDAIVKVFQKAFDEHLGYFGTVPETAEFERTLDKRGQYEAFKQAFELVAGNSWVNCCDAWLFHQDDIVAALQSSAGMSQEAANQLVENHGQSYSLSPEKFAQVVKAYVDTKGSQHHIVFMVDEVGQYVGDSTALMLNLQTVVEDLGTHCHGKAWVIVTSQEAIDEITKNRVKGNDFSKIVGRFGRPLSLSSANTDEVIKMRLLRKRGESVEAALSELYERKTASLKNQINFTSDCQDLPGYRSCKEFIAAYPFIPYQFTLLQKVFTQVRLMGSSGKHLASGERSLLDAFQIAGKQVCDQEVGILVPFYTFYLAIEGFLDSVITQVIVQAAENSQLQPTDMDLLKTMFMVKYVKEIRSNLENLTTLSLNSIDQDRLKLKEQVQEALVRLESQVLIQRVGEEYYFLTHEEQDIGREIKNTDLSPEEGTAELQRILWEELFTEKQFTYSKRNRYSFNRKLDDQVYGSQSHDIALHIITPYADRYSDFQADEACSMRTSSGDQVLVRLPEIQTLLDELEEMLKTSKYILRKNSSSLTNSIQSIISTRSDENQKRRKRIVDSMRTAIGEADVFACGNKINVSTCECRTVLTDGLKYLIDNVYTKLNYIESHFENEEDIRNALTRDSQVQNLEGDVPNRAAYQELTNFLVDQRRTSSKVTIRRLVDHFGKRPYGWSEFDTLGVMGELVNVGKVELQKAMETIGPKTIGLVAAMRSRTGVDAYWVQICDEVDPIHLRKAIDLANEFLEIEPSNDAVRLLEQYRARLGEKCELLRRWQKAAEDDELPFRSLLKEKLVFLQNLSGKNRPAVFLAALFEQREAMEDYMEDDDRLSSFFNQQLPLFKTARISLARLKPELRYLSDPDLARKVAEVEQILGMSDPTSRIPQIKGLLQPVEDSVKATLAQKQQETQVMVGGVREGLQRYVTAAHGQVADRMNLTTLLKPVEATELSSNVTTTIDSLIARQSELEQLRSRLQTAADDMANQLVMEEIPISGAIVKPIVSVRVSALSDKMVLDTAGDVQDYVDKLRDRLMAEIEQNNRVRVE